MDFFDDMYNLKSFILVYTYIPIPCTAALNLALDVLFLELTLAIKLSKGLIEMMDDKGLGRKPRKLCKTSPDDQKQIYVRSTYMDC